MSIDTDKITPRQVAASSLAGLIATGFGSGLSSVAPGTVGSLAAMLPAYLYVKYLPDSIGLIVSMMTIAVIVGIWACDRSGKQLGIADHPCLVWDEFVGQWLVLLAVPVSWAGWLAAFFLFRFFDIVKPWPVKSADQHIHGGWGVMLDDMLAAVYAVLILQLLQHQWPDLLLP